MKQRHYHVYILLLALLIILNSCIGMAAYHMEHGLPIMIFSSGTLLFLLYKLWQAASFLPNQVKYFLSSLKSRDAMSRFPHSNDAELRQMYQDMNSILQSYSQIQLDLETKRLYYDRILRIMTHELRNSITPIISLSEDMLHRQYSPEDSQEAVEVIHEQCSSIKGFLDSYYELTHLPQPSIREVDAKALLLHVERLYPEQNISIHCAQGLQLQCDEKLLRQVLINLVKNAIEAMAPSNGLITIVASAPNGNPRITVSDQGPGIPAEKLEDIFLPFYTSKTAGSGIGLALSRQIMRLHKGDLSCSGNEQDGATFIIQF